MGKWAEEFRRRFEVKQREDQHKSALKESNERLVNEGQENFWRGLRELARSAVEDINQPSEILKFIGPDIGEQDGFRLLFSSAGTQMRQVSVVFSPKGHNVAVAQRGERREYNIVAKDNKLVFEFAGGQHSPEAIVQQIISALLA